LDNSQQIVAAMLQFPEQSAFYFLGAFAFEIIRRVPRQ
jgi:hypothetical protein